MNLAAEVRILESKWEVFGIEGIEALPGTLNSREHGGSGEGGDCTLTEKPGKPREIQEEVQGESETAAELPEEVSRGSEGTKRRGFWRFLRFGRSR